MASQDSAPAKVDHDTSSGVDKGKGKEKKAAPQETRQEPRKDESLLSRITNSTVGLANSVLTGAPSSSILASAISEKGSTSAAAQQPSRTHHEDGLAQFRPDVAATAQPFRASLAQNHVAAEEAAFSEFLDSTPVFQPAGSSQMDDTTWHMMSMKETSNDPSDHSGTMYSSVAEQERHDGEAVVSLLMDANEHLPDSLDEDVLSPEEGENLRKALFDHSRCSTGEDVDWNHVLNFIPDYLRHEEPNADSYMDTGLSDPAEAWDSWVGQWQDVLTRYNDEVWGDLGSLIRQARQEVEKLAQVKQDGPPPDAPALRRLRAILGYLRG